MNPNHSNNRVCKFFSSSGDCYYGDSCQFMHINVNANQSPMSGVHGSHDVNHSTHNNCGPQTHTARPHQYAGNTHGMANNSGSSGTSGSNNHVHSFYNHHHNNHNHNNHDRESTSASLTTQIGQLQLDTVGNTHLMPFNTNSLTQTGHSMLHTMNNSPIMSSFFISDEMKKELTHKLTLSHTPANPEAYPDLPLEVDVYRDLLPLDSAPASSSSPSTSSTFGHNLTMSMYRASHTQPPYELVCLRRVHAFQPNTANARSLMETIEAWKQLKHPNIVQLKQVFTTRAFGDNSLVFVFEYCSGSETLMSVHFSDSHTQHTLNSNSSHMNGYSTPSRPYSQQQAHQRTKFLPEALLWNYIIQMSSALKAIHSANLSCRAFDPTKIILTHGKPNSTLQPLQYPRLKLSSCGVFDVITHNAFLRAGDPKQLTTKFQQEDMSAFGKICQALACNSLSVVTQRTQEAQIASLEMIKRQYSPDLTFLIRHLTDNSITRSIKDIMPMIGARFYTQLEALYAKDDILTGELAKEMDNGRLFRLLIKLGSINDRPEFGMDPNWCETGDRYMLKLFRDYLFHQLNEEGRPWIDLGHMVSTLNKLDLGTQEKICLISRDEQNILIVTYSELKRCLESSLNELLL